MQFYLSLRQIKTLFGLFQQFVVSILSGSLSSLITEKNDFDHSELCEAKIDHRDC